MPNPSSGHPPTGYDSLDRLRQYQRGILAPGGGSIVTPITLPNARTQQTYDLDGLGNWKKTQYDPVGGVLTTEQRQHNKLNQITRTKVDSTQIGFTYDKNGNLLNDGIRKYEYDAFNRLVNVYKDPNGTPGGSGGSGGPTLIATYTYDALNRRIRKVVSNGGESGNVPDGVTDYIYSGSRCVEERTSCASGGGDGNGGGNGGGSEDTPTKQYVWGIYLDELIQQRHIAAPTNSGSDIDLYPLQDLLYRTTGLADSTGVIREAYDTDAYGNTLIFRNAGSPPAPITFTDGDTQVDFPICDFIFTGQRYDAESRIYHYKARFYVPELGRFGQKDYIDPVLSSYKYADGNPLVLLDALGYIPHGAAYLDYGDGDGVHIQARPTPQRLARLAPLDADANPPIPPSSDVAHDTYNCAGLAFRDFTYPGHKDVIAKLSNKDIFKLKNCSDNCRPCGIKFRFWLWCYSIYKKGRFVKDMGCDDPRSFHIVASPTSCSTGKELDSHWKNASGQPSGPSDPLASHPAILHRLYPPKVLTPSKDANDDFDEVRIKIRREECYCANRRDLPGWS